MRWWAAVWAVAGVVALAACGTSAGGGGPSHRPSPSRSPGGSPSRSAGRPPSGSPSGPSSPSPSRTARPSPSASPSAGPSAANCVAGHAEVTVRPGDPVERNLCARPGTVVSLVLQPRADDKRWTAASSSAPVFVLASGWRLDADGTAHVSLRCAGTRGGTAKVTALAKAPDVAGAARVVFTLHMSVVPYPTQG